MRDPLLDDDSQPILAERQRLPDEWRATYLTRAIEQLPGDITRAFDSIWTLEREKDKLRRDLEEAKGNLRSEQIKSWILGFVVGGQGIIIGWVVTRIAPLIFHVTK